VDVVMFGRDRDKTAKMAGQFGLASSTEMDAAFADDSVDLVDVCLPIRLHAEYVLRALQVGKHALVELPLADNLADARGVVEAAERSDRHVFVDMFERFIPANQALLDAVRDGTYGRLEQLSLWNLTAHLWPGVSLGLSTLPLQAMHSDTDIITGTLGRPRELTVAAVARDSDSASIEATMRFDGAFARSSVSSLMPTA
jgi:predicted dehydrogenase